MKKVLLQIIILVLTFNSVNIFSPVYAEDGSGYVVPLDERDGWVAMTDDTYGQFEFSKLQQYPQPFVNEAGRTLFPLTYFDEIFRDGLSYDMTGDAIAITKNVLGTIAVIELNINSNILVKNGEEIVMDAAPVRSGDVVYIPLRAVGEALGYSVTWRNITSESWPGGAVNFEQFTSCFIYIWNENKDSSPDGLRYSYFIGDEIADISEIKANAYESIDEAFSAIESLPNGAKVLTTALYGVNGYKIQRETVDSINKSIMDMGYRVAYTSRPLDVVPAVINGLEDYTNEWYSEELFSLDEEAIYNSEKEIYRFSCFPAFWGAETVRIEIKDDGSADIYYKVGSGEVNEYDGGLLTSEKAEMDINETNEFLDLIKGSGYWGLPKEIDRMGLDGYTIVVEGVKDGKYHIVNRWVPTEDDPVYDLQEYFDALIERKFSE